MKTTPLSVVHFDNAGKNPSAGTTKPPSPWMGSINSAATLWAPMSDSMILIACAAASAPLSPSRYG